MKYRKCPHGNEMISIIGMGSGAMGNKSDEEVKTVIHKAVDAGINYFDMAAGKASVFKAYGKAFEGIRDKVYLQVHFGAIYQSGDYGWSIQLEDIKQSVEWMLKKLNTDYIDFGMIHCIDEMSDLKQYMDNGVLDYIRSLKEKGIVRHIGLSSHTPEIVNAVLDMNIIDMVMFSINPAFDYHIGKSSVMNGSFDERGDMYKRCESMGVGISVMKPYFAGKLLSDEKSPFHQALSIHQCLQYALDKPGVLTVLPGVGSEKELDETLKFFDEEEHDYSILGSFTENNATGKCLYCRHCHPCPMGLDIALINKYYDCALMGDDMAKEHYMNLNKHASDCINCGHCDKRCPFKVKQSSRMKEIAQYFNV